MLDNKDKIHHVVSLMILALIFVLTVILPAGFATGISIFFWFYAGIIMVSHIIDTIVDLWHVHDIDIAR